MAHEAETCTPTGTQAPGAADVLHPGTCPIRQALPHLGTPLHLDVVLASHPEPEKEVLVSPEEQESVVLVVHLVEPDFLLTGHRPAQLHAGAGLAADPDPGPDHPLWAQVGLVTDPGLGLHQHALHAELAAEVHHQGQSHILSEIWPLTSSRAQIRTLTWMIGLPRWKDISGSPTHQTSIWLTWQQHSYQDLLQKHGQE